MRFLLLNLFLLCLFCSSAFANGGVGEPMKQVLEDNFASFFNITEQSTTPLTLGQKEIHYKTGGFKEYIDLYMIVDNKNTLLSARIEVQYKFISEQSTFAIDVIKSFIMDFCHQKDDVACKTLAMRLYEGEGIVDKTVAGAMAVLNGKKKWDSSTLDGCIFTTQTKKNGLEFAYYFINWEEKSIPEKSFLSEQELKPYKLKATQKEANFVVWANYEEKETVPFQRLVDGHWAFKTSKEAVQYFRACQLQQSEGMDLMAIEDDLEGQVIAYKSGAQQQEMMAMLGIDKVSKAYIFLLQKEKQVAKLFVMCNPEGDADKALNIAKKMLTRLP